jgi:hypothetical protein
MRKATLTIPEIMLIGGTRAALGAGLALLFGDRLARSERRTVGLTLLLIGVVSTLPLALDVLSKKPSGQLARGD